MEVFILAAGLGTRLKPITDLIPKALVEINGRRLLEILLTKLASCNTGHIVINVHHFGDKILEFLRMNNNFGLNIEISDERALLLDTGGGLKKALSFLKEENFLIHNVDILTNLDISSLMKAHASGNNLVTLAVQRRSSSRYFLFDEEKHLCGWENVKTGEKKIVRRPEGKLLPFAFSGIHVANRKLASFMPLEDVFSIVDFYLSIAGNNIITYFDHTGTEFVDLGKKENLEEASKILRTL